MSGPLFEIPALRTEIEDLKKTIDFYRGRPPMTSSMILWAFRYCLGRSTYAVMDCVEYLLLYWERIAIGTREQILMELFNACGKGDCGMEMDKSQWHRVFEKAGFKYTKSNGWRKEEPCTTNGSGSKL